MSDKSNYDVIVIGSGIGGSTPALLLAKFFNKKVLVIEKHWQFGGLTHSFEVDGKTFNPGIHYIGNVNDGSTTDQIFDIVTGHTLTWLPMPLRYDNFVFPSYSFGFPASEKKLKEALCEAFPEEQKAIKRFLKDTKKAYNFLITYTAIRSFAPKPMHWIIKLIRMFQGFNPNIALQTYMDKHFKNERLKNILMAQWKDYGVKPEEASFMVHSMVFQHYIEGAYYPKGGAKSIAKRTPGMSSSTSGRGIAKCYSRGDTY